MTRARNRVDVLMQGGNVDRMHTSMCNKHRSVAHHSWGISLLIETLIPVGHYPPFEMYYMHRYAVLHDVAELAVGDIPAPVKWELGKDFVKRIDELENEFMAEQGVGDDHITRMLTPEQKGVLKIFDLFDLMHHVLEERRMGNSTLDQIFTNCVEAVGGTITHTFGHGDKDRLNTSISNHHYWLCQAYLREGGTYVSEQ